MSSTVTPSSTGWLRPLGTTGLVDSAIAAGGDPVGGMPELFGYACPNGRRCSWCEKFCTALSGRVIDTANGYSDGKSEARIGTAIREEGGIPDGFLVVTKVDARDGGYSGRRIHDSINESRDRLGMEAWLRFS